MHVAVDLDWFVQVIGFGLLSLLLFWFLVKKTASWYFLDSTFDSDSSSSSSSSSSYQQQTNCNSNSNSNMGLPDSCAVCGKTTSKQCARCKITKYCSGSCQLSHWNSGHKEKCQELQSSYKANHENSTSVARGRRSIFRQGSSKMFEPSNKVLFPYEDFVELFNYDRMGNYPPCGLINCGNSCFANVVLQCLAYTRPLVAYLLEKHQKECYNLNWCFFCEFQKHVEKASQSVCPFSPINILSKLPDIGANFGYGNQEDAHEFMRFAIANMQSFCLDKFGGEKAVHPSFQETTLIQHIFGGRLQSQVVCTECNNVSNKFENMMDLTVEIHGDAESLEECLDQFTAKEQLHGDNMYKCDGCNAYVKAWKRLLIQRAPNILTITLKRFQSGRFGKLNKKVSFPETLDLKPYKNELEDGNDIYKLYAVIVHVDMLNASFFGHYICYVKDFLGNWFRVDDCKVQSVDLEEVLSQGAYMLMYSRICVRPTCLLPQETLRKEEDRNLKIQKPAESSSLASECLDNTVDREQPSCVSEINTSGAEVENQDNSEPSPPVIKDVQPSSISEINISGAEVENQDNSEPNLPIIKDVELDQVEDLSTTSSMDIDANQPDGQDMELSSLVAVEDATQGSKTGASDKFSNSTEEYNVSENCTFEERKNACSVSASELHNSSRELSTAPESITEYINRPHIANNTSLIDQVGDQPNVNSAEFSSPMDVEDSTQGSEESHAIVSGTYEEDKSMGNDSSSSVITNGKVNPANSIHALENGSTSSSCDIQDAITKSDPRNSAATMKQNVCASKSNLSNGSTSSHGSAVKLKPIFTPGFLGKRTRKEVPANISKLAPKSVPNDQSNIKLKMENSLLSVNGSQVKDE